MCLAALGCILMSCSVVAVFTSTMIYAQPDQFNWKQSLNRRYRISMDCDVHSDMEMGDFTIVFLQKISVCY